MSETSYEIEKVVDFQNKIPVISLNNLIIENAKIAGAREITSPRKKTGSTDFASLMYYVPGACIRVPFVEKGMPAHSKYWFDRGKTEDAHVAIVVAAKILAMSAFDLISDEKIMSVVRTEFQQEKLKNNQI